VSEQPRQTGKSWSEQAQRDSSLQTFIEGEINRAGIDVHTAQVELEHCREVIADQERQILQLQAQLGAKKGKP
jgi:hypothetical protein